MYSATEEQVVSSSKLTAYCPVLVFVTRRQIYPGEAKTNALSKSKLEAVHLAQRSTEETVAGLAIRSPSWRSSSNSRTGFLCLVIPNFREYELKLLPWFWQV